VLLLVFLAVLKVGMMGCRVELTNSPEFIQSSKWLILPPGASIKIEAKRVVKFRVSKTAKDLD